MQSQLLDNMEIEKERGITVKSQAVRMNYKLNGEEYVLNLIDTPGHVDFNYEVSRSLAACEGAILVVDASQGVEAQTLANVYLAIEGNLEIIPVLNKVDLPNARTEEVKKEIEDVIGIPAMDAPCVSAKTGLNIEEVLERIISDIPAPKGDEKEPLKALIFDSEYDNYKGVISHVRIFDGIVKKDDEILFMAVDKKFVVTEVGYFIGGQKVPTNLLKAGEVGYIAASVKNAKDVQVGDTITLTKNRAEKALPGYKEAKSMVYCGIFPMDGKDYEPLKEALEKLKLNDASLVYEPETSQALGFGFRCGFLGLLHMEIIKERLTREFDIDAIVTTPSVLYKATLTSGENIDIDSPQKMPEVTKIKTMSEPYILATILSPDEFIGGIMNLCQDKRGIYKEMTYLDKTRVKILYELPLAEIVYDFFDKLKSITKGYASFDYEIIGYKESNLVKIDILVNSEKVDALSLIAPKENAYERGKIIVDALKEVIPRALFEIPIQASLNAKVIARSTVKAMRKDVLAKCYGGDVSRKKKLLEKQKKGKKKMKMIGSVELPTEAFLAILKTDE